MGGLSRGDAESGASETKKLPVSEVHRRIRASMAAEKASFAPLDEAVGPGHDEGDIECVEDLDDVEDIDTPYRPPPLKSLSPGSRSSLERSGELSATPSAGGSIPAALNTLASNAPLSPAQRIKMDIKLHRDPSEESRAGDSSDPEADFESTPSTSSIQKMSKTMPRQPVSRGQAPQTGLLARPRSAKSSTSSQGG